jgi:hypothetical protein
VVWTGDRFGIVWNDRRFDNYEVFFAMFDSTGHKMAPGDVRVTNTPGFSVGPALVWTGAEFVTVWQDGEGSDGSFDAYAQRIDLNGSLIGDNVRLTQAGGESPRLAAGRPGLGVAWTRKVSDIPQVFFRAFDYQLQPIGQEVQLSPSGTQSRYPDIIWNRDVFDVAWEYGDPSRAVWGATIDGNGSVVVAAKAITDSPRFARNPSLIPLGDRMIVVYADDRDQNGGFEIYSRMLDSQLGPMSDAGRITTHTADSVNPIAQLGPNGEIGVLFRDNREGPPQTYFTSLVCKTR